MTCLAAGIQALAVISDSKPLLRLPQPRFSMARGPFICPIAANCMVLSDAPTTIL
jgi:hypothetical protein